MWIIYIFTLACVLHKPLPKLHFRVMLVPGSISGILWSIGNIFAIYAVEELGEGVGYGSVQAAIMISGLWGIFYYREIRGLTILWWFLSCTLCVSGIVTISLMKYYAN